MSMKACAVKKLAEMAGVSVRTLHYYDHVGLLKPEFFTRAIEYYVVDRK